VEKEKKMTIESEIREIAEAAYSHLVEKEPLTNSENKTDLEISDCYIGCGAMDYVEARRIFE